MDDTMVVIKLFIWLLFGFIAAGVLLWLVLKILAFLGLYDPTGPVTQRIMKLFILGFVLILGLGMTIMVVYLAFNHIVSLRGTV